MKYPPVNYHDYLGLDKLLSCQERRSEQLGKPAHDEMLFITVHQAYEIWFKQIIFELDSCLKIFSQQTLEESQMGFAVARLERIVSILKLVLGQIDVLETMTALDFLEFRDMLYPASGFQSFQFRLLEIKLGLRTEDRLSYDQTHFLKHLKEEQQKIVTDALESKSLFDTLESWLERTPFITQDNFNFWNHYRTAVHQMFAEDRNVIATNERLNPESKARNMQILDESLKSFESLFDQSQFEKLREQKYFRLKHNAVKAALMIQLYRDEPILQLPFKFLQLLLDIDESLTQWRYRHAQMVFRMLGRKIGTGGSSGHDYLKSATEKHRVFSDLFQINTFLIPRSKVPPLPPKLKEAMSFHY